MAVYNLYLISLLQYWKQKMKNIPHGPLCLCAACQALPRSVIDTYLREVVCEVWSLKEASHLWQFELHLQRDAMVKIVESFFELRDHRLQEFQLL
jgi:hypothetical protein